MLFNSLGYLVFLPLVLVLYYGLPQKLRWMLLLAASYYFYACWRTEYLLLIVVSTLIVYAAGLGMGRKADKRSRKPLLVLSLAANLAILFFFKYYGFFDQTMQALLSLADLRFGLPSLDLLLPVGISYYTFQSMSYAMDIYRGARQPEKHLGIFALYISFFPQLLAGPIERSSNLIPQLRCEQGFHWPTFREGLLRLLFGMFKKVVIADRLAIYVDQVYAGAPEESGPRLLLATYFFAYQLYCDFSGYSDMAIGSAQMMGIRLSENFNRPFAARSIREFWQRWHITFTTWIRDYLFMPLLGRSLKRSRYHFATLASFVVIGFWHGANWTFVLFGAIHGFYIFFSDWSKKTRKRYGAALWGLLERARIPGLARARGFLEIMVTFHLVLATIVFFRSASVQEAADIFAAIGGGFLTASRPLLTEAFDLWQFGIACSAIVFLETGQWLLAHRREAVFAWLERGGTVGRWSLYYAVIVSLLCFGTYDGKPFIYFQF